MKNKIVGPRQMLSEYYYVMSDFPLSIVDISRMLQTKPLYQSETNFNPKVDYTVISPQPVLCCCPIPLFPTPMLTGPLTHMNKDLA